MLKKVRQEAQNLDREGMQVQAFEGQILKLLVHLARAKNILEVGTFLGYSSIWMAEALPEDGRMTCLEKSEENAQKAQSFFEQAGVSHKVNVLCGDAEENLQQLAKEEFDLIFIDANKAAYERYLDWSMQRVRVGGLIVGDNTFLFGNVYLPQEEAKVSKNQWSAMRAFNQKLAEAPGFVSAMLPTDEGMTIGMRLN